MKKIIKNHTIVMQKIFVRTKNVQKIYNEQEAIFHEGEGSCETESNKNNNDSDGGDDGGAVEARNDER